MKLKKVLDNLKYWKAFLESGSDLTGLDLDKKRNFKKNIVSILILIMS